MTRRVVVHTVARDRERKGEMERETETTEIDSIHHPKQNSYTPLGLCKR